MGNDNKMMGEMKDIHWIMVESNTSARAAEKGIVRDGSREMMLFSAIEGLALCLEGCCLKIFPCKQSWAFVL